MKDFCTESKKDIKRCIYQFLVIPTERLTFTRIIYLSLKSNYSKNIPIITAFRLSPIHAHLALIQNSWTSIPEIFFCLSVCSSLYDFCNSKRHSIRAYLDTT